MLCAVGRHSMLWGDTLCRGVTMPHSSGNAQGLETARCCPPLCPHPMCALRVPPFPPAANSSAPSPPTLPPEGQMVPSETPAWVLSWLPTCIISPASLGRTNAIRTELSGGGKNPPKTRPQQTHPQRAELCAALPPRSPTSARLKVTFPMETKSHEVPPLLPRSPRARIGGALRAVPAPMDAPRSPLAVIHRVPLYRPCCFLSVKGFARVLLPPPSPVPDEYGDPDVLAVGVHPAPCLLNNLLLRVGDLLTSLPPLDLHFTLDFLHGELRALRREPGGDVRESGEVCAQQLRPRSWNFGYLLQLGSPHGCSSSRSAWMQAAD